MSAIGRMIPLGLRRVHTTYCPSFDHFFGSGELRNDDAILAWITKELQAVDIPEVKPR